MSVTPKPTQVAPAIQTGEALKSALVATTRSETNPEAIFIVRLVLVSFGFVRNVDIDDFKSVLADRSSFARRKIVKTRFCFLPAFAQSRQTTLQAQDSIEPAPSAFSLANGAARLLLFCRYKS